VSLLDSLNPQQRRAVAHTDGPLLIFAGAGSGKTRVLTYRIAYLIREQGIEPRNILAVTFTNKAADEMKERIRALIGEKSRHLWAGTFHSICARILRQEAESFGIDPDFVIFDEADQNALIRECLSVRNLDPKVYRPPVVLNTISNAKNELMTPRRFQQTVKDDFEKQIASVYYLYQRLLKENNAFDFDDLIMRTVELLKKHKRACERYQERFHHVLVDEYQDINHAQYQLTRILAGKYKNLCVVGDDDQSIYGWRGANVKIILDFEKDFPSATTIKLEQNYRSTQKILECANEVICKNKGRAGKRLWTNNPTGDNIICYEAVSEHEEAQFVANTIAEAAANEGRRWSDFSVLYRTNAQSRVVEEALLNLGIPYRIVGGLRFYDRKEIKDFVAYLRVILNHRDSVSLRRIINTPTRGIGDKTVAALDRFAHQENISLYEALQRVGEYEDIPRAGKEAAQDFAEMMESLAKAAETAGLMQLANEVLERTRYIETLLAEGTAEAAARAENLKEFVSLAKEFEEAGEGRGLAEFLEHISLLSDIDEAGDVGNQVTLMTLHSAKGLEFPIVFILGLEEGIFPHQRCMDEPEQIEEERRLCYVGMTRAQEKLFLTYAYRRTVFGNTEERIPSRFLAELPDKFVDRHAGISALRASVPRSIGEEALTAGGPKLNVVEILSGRRKAGGKSTDAGEKEGSGASGIALPDEAPFRAGDKVEHTKFGRGVVVQVKGNGAEAEVTVAFPGEGIKKLSVRYAPLAKVG